MPVDDQAVKDWINTDEALYLWFLSTGMTLDEFIKKYHGELVTYIIDQLGKL